MTVPKIASLFNRYYFDRPDYESGTVRFHHLCRRFGAQDIDLLEIGAGESNPTTCFLSSFARVIGIDVSPEVVENADLTHAIVFAGDDMPIASESYAECVSNYVLEHIANPEAHFREVARVLMPGGTYVFRTPNLWHYITMASWMLPHRTHLAIANRLRGLPSGSHDPWPTVYRANTRKALSGLAAKAGLRIIYWETVEREPSYGRAAVWLFYPMMVYERIVNSSSLFAMFRSNIFSVMIKPPVTAKQRTESP